MLTSPECNWSLSLLSSCVAERANQGWKQDVAAEQLSPTRDRHYATRGGGGGQRGNLKDPLIKKKKKKRCTQGDTVKNARFWKKLRCGRNATVVLQSLQHFPQEESDFTAAQDTYYLRVKVAWESCWLITDCYREDRVMLKEVPGQWTTKQLCKHWWVSGAVVLIRDACGRLLW